MAKTNKKKPASNEPASSNILDNIKNEINDAMGELVAYNLETEDPLKVKQWFSTGSTLIDLITRGDIGKGDQRGGIPSGRIFMLNGESGAGKSLILWHLIKDVIDKGGVALYLDTEGATDLDFPRMIGVDMSKVVFIPPEKCETIEKAFAIIDKFFVSLLKSKNKDMFGIVGVDSFTQLSTEEEFEEDGLSSRQYPTKARIASKLMRKIKGVVPQTNICMCFTNQLRTDIGDTSFFGDKMTVPTGTAQFFAASTVLRLWKSSKVKGDTKGDILGQVIRVKCEKSRFTRPYREVKIPLHFEYGLQNEISIYDKLDELKLFEGKTKVKKWITGWEGKQGAIQEKATAGDEWIFKFNSKNWEDLYNENEDLRDWCDEKLLEYFMKPSKKWFAGDILSESSDVYEKQQEKQNIEDNTEINNVVNEVTEEEKDE